MTKKDETKNTRIRNLPRKKVSAATEKRVRGGAFQAYASFVGQKQGKLKGN
jgi:hypothetical protein